ncbi:MAG TPA: NACHT domain-containing protein, partial [Anaerolineales bacterium]|nr:NACHT domain-containing protein [Anaerolineales bacterium]
AFNGHTIPIEKILLGGANIIITGRHGSGKTTALAYLVSLLARRDKSLGELQNHLPVFLHVNEFDMPIETEDSLLEPIVKALITRASALGQARLPDALKIAFREGRAILALDGFDEIDNEAAQHITGYLEQILQEYPQVRMIVAADPQFVDGLLHLGLAPVPIAAWNRRQQARFIQRWSNLWERFIAPPVKNDPESDEMDTHISPMLLNGWLLNNNAALNPLEFTLKVWAAYAGDSRGPSGTDAIEAYLRRTSVGISKARSAMEYISTQMILSRRTSFTQKEAQHWTATFDTAMVEGAGVAMTSEMGERYATREITIPRVLADLTRNGLLISRPGNRLETIHPQIASYLAGAALAFSGQGAVILNQEDWPLRQSTIHYLASHSDLSDEASRLLTDTVDPLYRGALIAGRWLRDIPDDTTWQKPILQHLANLLQRDALPLNFRGRVLACLVTSNTPGMETMFRHLLRSPKDDVAQLAALGCGFLQDTQSVGELTQIAGYPTLAGQAACLSLINIGTQPAIETAASILLSGDELLRRAVAEAFAFHPEEGYEILRDGSTLDDLLVRRSSIHGLRLIEEPWALKILEEMQIEDGQWVVRNAAAQVVEELHALDPYIPRPLTAPENLEWLIEFASEREMGVSPGDP